MAKAQDPRGVPDCEAGHLADNSRMKFDNASAELAIAEAANELATLLESKGLRHPVHAAVLEPAYASMKALMRRFFRIQKKGVLKAIAPHIRHQLVIRRATKTESLREGWVTINGSHVFLNDAGKIIKGPASLIGDSKAELKDTEKPKEWQGVNVKHTTDHKELSINAKYSITGPHYIKTTDLTKSQSYTDKATVEKYEKKISGGNMNAIIARKYDGKLYVSDSHHHLQAAENLGFKTVPVVIISPPSSIKEALTPPPEEQAARHAANAIVPDTLDPLLFSATANQARIYDSLIQQAFKDAADQIAEEYGGDAALADDALAAYLRDNSLSKLTGGLAQTSIEELQTAIADAYLKGGGYDEIVQVIKDKFDGFSDSRAGMIAQTEVNDAYNQGRYEMASSLGFNRKSWEVDAMPCLVCIANELAGWIEIGETFPSGDDAPTAHPNCYCSLGFKIETAGH